MTGLHFKECHHSGKSSLLLGFLLTVKTCVAEHTTAEPSCWIAALSQNLLRCPQRLCLLQISPAPIPWCPCIALVSLFPGILHAMAIFTQFKGDVWVKRKL